MGRQAYNVVREVSAMRDYKIIRVTDKRQLTIPKGFYEKLGVSREVKCYIKEGALVIEPLKPGSFWDFSTEILKEILEEGYQDKEVLVQFEKRKAQVEFAIRKMGEEARQEMAKGKGRPAREVFDELYSDSAEDR